MTDWSDHELRSAVHAYLAMLDLQERNEPYSKAEVRRGLREGPLNARSEASIEYRMRNISAVLKRHGRATLQGYVAADNVGEAVAERIWALVREADAAPGIPPAPQVWPNGHSSGKEQASPAPLIYFNIGWMVDYAGAVPSDPTIGAHGYLGEHVHGAEAFNFLPGEDGLVRGYRPPGKKDQINLERLGARPRAETIDGVTVIWLAREPGTGRSLIVGWYKNARVYRHARAGGMVLNGEEHCYSVEARGEDAALLPPVARTFVVPSSRTAPGDGYGQKPTWYGSDRTDQRVRAYLASFAAAKSPRRPAKPPLKPPRNNDPELRRKVERAAVEHAIGYYKSLYGKDCPVVSVETDAKGWDLEVQCGPEPLLVEVKGLLNASLVCELTPNEYEKMRDDGHRHRYVVYVVTNALAEAPAVPIASVFEHADGVWKTSDGRELQIREKLGAVLSCERG